jgi:hypothetical protein
MFSKNGNKRLFSLPSTICMKGTTKPPDGFSRNMMLENSTEDFDISKF